MVSPDIQELPGYADMKDSRINGLVHVLLVFVLLTLASCDMPKHDWQKAEAEQSIEAYQAHLTRFPESPYGDEAYSKIEQLRYQDAKKADTVEAYDSFLAEHPRGATADLALDRIDALRYEQVRADGSEAAIVEFIEAYPKSRHLKKAQRLLFDLRLDIAKKKDTIEGYESFLRMHESAEVDERIRELRLLEPEVKLVAILRSASRIRLNLQFDQERLSEQDRISQTRLEEFFHHPIELLIRECGITIANDTTSTVDLEVSVSLYARPESEYLRSIYSAMKGMRVPNYKLTLQARISSMPDSTLTFGWSDTGTSTIGATAYIVNGRLVSEMLDEQFPEALAATGVFDKLIQIFLDAFGPSRLVPVLADGGLLGAAALDALRPHRTSLSSDALIDLLEDESLSLNARGRIVELIGAEAAALKPADGLAQLSLHLFSENTVPPPSSIDAAWLPMLAAALRTEARERASRLLSVSGEEAIDPIIDAVYSVYFDALRKRKAGGFSSWSGGFPLNEREESYLRSATIAIKGIGDVAIERLVRLLNSAGRYRDALSIRRDHIAPWVLRSLVAIDSDESWTVITLLAEGDSDRKVITWGTDIEIRREAERLLRIRAAFKEQSN